MINSPILLSHFTAAVYVALRGETMPFDFLLQLGEAVPLAGQLYALIENMLKKVLRQHAVLYAKDMDTRAELQKLGSACADSACYRALQDRMDDLLDQHASNMVPFLNTVTLLHFRGVLMPYESIVSLFEMITRLTRPSDAGGVHLQLTPNLVTFVGTACGFFVDDDYGEGSDDIYCVFKESFVKMLLQKEWADTQVHEAITTLNLDAILGLPTHASDSQLSSDPADHLDVDVALAEDLTLKAIYLPLPAGGGYVGVLLTPADVQRMVTTAPFVVYRCPVRDYELRGEPAVKVNFYSLYYQQYTYVKREDLKRMTVSTDRKFLCSLDVDPYSPFYSREAIWPCSNLLSVSHCDDKSEHSFSRLYALRSAAAGGTPIADAKNSPGSRGEKRGRGNREPPAVDRSRRRLQLGGGEHARGFFAGLRQDIMGGAMSERERKSLMKRMGMQAKLLKAH